MLNWRVESPAPDSQLPIPRSGHRIIYFNGQIFSFGGYNPNTENLDHLHTLLQELWKFNLITKKWQKIELSGLVPSSTASHTAKFCVINGKAKMIVYGGTGYPFGSNSSSNIYVCDLLTGEFDILNVTYDQAREIDRPAKLYGQAVCLVKGRYFYTVGGTTGHQYHMDVHRLDLETRTWKRLCEGRVSLEFLENTQTDPSPR